MDNTAMAEALEQCAKELEEGEWIQGQAGHREKGRCAVRVIGDFVIENHLNNYTDTMALLRNQLHLFLKLPGPGSVMAWNDAPGRTKEEVIDAFIGTAKELRNKG